MDQTLLLYTAPSQLLPPAENYNNFFHPNVCHVCKTTKRLMECPSCRMISYCSEEHRMLHRAQHNEICQAILTCSTHWSIYNSRGKTLEEWTEFKEMNMQCITYSLNRDLELHEREMFLFAKSCIVCRVQNNLVASCVNCFSVNMCVNHCLYACTHSCKQLLRCFSLLMESAMQNNRDSRVPTKYLLFDKSVVHDMPTFIQACTQRERKATTWTLNNYIHTDDFSGPLTLVHAMQRVKLLYYQQKSNSFVVYIIAGSYMDTRSLSAWEILLHEFPQHTRLIIAVIGPTVHDRNLIWKCCLNCRENSKELQFEYRRILCHKYVQNMCHGISDVTIGFNMDLGSNKICSESMKALWRQSRLLILTAKSESKADCNIKWMRKVLDIAPLVSEKNKFASLRPHRDHENDSVFYPNQHVVIYRNLSNISGSAQTNCNIRERL